MPRRCINYISAGTTPIPADLNPLAARGDGEEAGGVHGRRRRPVLTRGPRGFCRRAIPLGRQRHEPAGVRRSGEQSGARPRRRRAWSSLGYRARPRPGATPICWVPPNCATAFPAQRGDGANAELLKGRLDRPRLRFLGVRLNAAKAEGSTSWSTGPSTDLNQSYAMNLENSALTHHCRKARRNADVSVTLTRAALDAIR